MDIGKFKGNYQYYDDSLFVDSEIVLTIKENPELNIHIGSEYFHEIFEEPVFDGRPWRGFTRDYQELKGAFSVENIYGIEMSNPQEYLDDMMNYLNKKFKSKETREAFDLIVNFLRFAISEGKNVFVEES